MLRFRNFLILEVLLILLYFYGYLLFQLFVNCHPTPAPVFNPRHAIDSTYNLIFPCPVGGGFSLMQLVVYYLGIAYAAIFFVIYLFRYWAKKFNSHTD